MLCERETELGLVADALHAAADGRGSLLVITGPLGIGKTALLQSLPSLASLQGARVLRASGALLEQDFAFGVVRQLLEPALAAAGQEDRDRWLGGAASQARLVFDDSPRTDAAGQLDYLSWGDDRPAGAVRHTVLHGLLALVTTMSVDRPVLMILDDLQWTDGPSLRWLGYLAKRLAGARVTVVVTVREGDPLSERALVREVTDSAHRTLRPGTLSVASTRLMVAEEFGEPGEDAFVRACHEVSDGNPMFLMTVLLGMAVSGYRPIAADAEIARSLLPSQLRERLTSCLGTQPAPIQAFVKAMAVLGDQTDAELLGQLAELDPIGCVEATRVLDRMGLLASSVVPRFIHLSVQDAVEQLMSAEEAETLHRRAAALLHADGYPAEQVAAQLLAVSADRDQWAISVLRAAADTALCRGAPEAATRYLRRALLDCSPDGADRAVLLVELATAECWFDPAAAVRHVSQAVPLLRSTRERALAVVRIAPSLLGVTPSPVLDVVRQVAGELGDPDLLRGEDRELALCLEARLLCTQYENPEQLSTAADRLRALGSKPPLDTGGERELAAVLLHAATLTGGVSATEAISVARQILEREPAAAGHAHTAAPLIVTTLIAADASEIVTPWLDLALEQARRRNATVPQAIVAVRQAVVLVHQAKLAEGSALAAEALDLADQDWLRSVSQPTISLVAVALESGSVELAERILARCEERPGGVSALWPLQVLRAWLAARAGEPSIALARLHECGRRMERSGWHNPAILPWRSWASALHHKIGEHTESRELIRVEHARALAWGAPAALGRALRVWGMITEGERGIDLLRESVTTLRSSGHRLERARASAALGRRLREIGSPEAETYLRRSGRLGNEPWFDLPARGTVPRTELTKTERRVAALASDGHTNHEIAEQLAVSLRAVEKHLTNVYRKLELPGRAGLAGALRAR